MGLFFEVLGVISPGKKILISGQLLTINQSKLIFRKAQPILSSTQGIFYVWNGDFIKIDSPIMTLLYRKLKIGDIVQGIPKIEHFFEVFKSKTFFWSLSITRFFGQFIK